MNNEQSDMANREKAREGVLTPLQPAEEKPLCCGPGCACDGAPGARKARITVMLVIVAAVVAAMLFKGIL